MKVKNNIFLILELLLLFVLLPVSFCFSYPIAIKSTISLSAFLYLIINLVKQKYSFFRIDFKAQAKDFGKQIAWNLTGLIIITFFYIWNTQPDNLFNVIKTNPTMWLTFIAIYSFLSVIPQEIIYRSFYFNRYRKLFPNETIFILSNAFIFSLGHIFFKNILVLGVTFIGGFIFAYTYNKTKSLILVCIEHIIYGCWLYTVGLGEILGFPIP